MSVIVSFVLLSEEVKPQNKDIRAFLAANWKDLPPAADFSEGDSTLMFDIGPAKIALLRMAAPFPWSDPTARSCCWNTRRPPRKNRNGSSGDKNG
jgi:hypothetical protein